MMRSELFDGFYAEGSQGALGDFADAGNFADGQRCQEARSMPGATQTRPRGLP